MENNNNDMAKVKLLTMIGALVLFVSVVGATFAYFTVGATGTSSTTITATTPAVGTLTLKSGTALKLNLRATDMTKDLASTAGKSWYSSTTGTPTDKVPTPSAVATLSVSGGPASQKYTCTSNFKITTTLTASKSLVEGEAILHLSGDTGVTIPAELQNLDLSTTVGTGKTGDVEFEITANTTPTTAKTASVKGYLEFKNTASDQTSRLSDATITVKVEGAKPNCEVAE